MPIKQMELEGQQENRFDSSASDLIKASFAVTVNGATNFMNPDMDKRNYIDENFSLTNPDVNALFDTYQIQPSERGNFYDSRNYDHLVASLEKNKFYKDSQARLQEDLPIGQYPLMMATGLFDPVDLALMPLGYKALGTIKSLHEATRGNNMLKAGIATGFSATTSEYLLQQSHSIDENNLAQTALLTSLLGGGAGALLPTAKSLPLDKQDRAIAELGGSEAVDAVALEKIQQDVAGYNDWNHLKEGYDGKIEGWKAKFVWSPISRMMRSDNKVLRAVGGSLEASPLALSKDGEIVKSIPNAMNSKYNLNGTYIQTVMKPLQEDFNAYKAEGGTLKGQEWLESLGTSYRQHLAEIENEAWLKFDDMSDEARMALYKEVTGLDEIADDFEDVIISRLTRDIEPTKAVDKSLQRVKNYYDFMQKQGEELEVSALKGRNGRAYMNRVFNNEAIERMGTNVAVGKLRQAMEAHPSTQREMTRLQLEGKSVKEISDELNKHAEAVIKKIQSATVHSEMDYTDMKDIMAGTSPFKARKLKIHEPTANDLLVNDITNLTEFYNYKTAPKIALKRHLGIDSKQDIQAIEKAIEEEGRKLGQNHEQIAKDLDDFRAVLDSVNGTRELAKNPNAIGQRASRMFTKFNYVTFGGMFAVNTLAELGTVTSVNGIKAFKQLVPAMSEAMKMYRKQPLKSTTNELLGMGLLESIYRSNKVNRYDSVDMMNTKGTTESLLDKGSNFMSNASGLNFVTTALEIMTGSSTLNDLLEMAGKGKLTRTEQKRLARLGLDANDLNNLRKTNKAEFDSNGYLLNYNFEKWTDQELVAKIRNGIQESIKNGVLQADATTLPKFATNPNAFNRVILQFLRFPIGAHERILLKGLDEFNARQATGFLMSAGLMAFVFTMREEAMIQAGFIDERDRKYDLETEEGMMNLGSAISTKIPFFGISQPVAEGVAKMAGLSPTYGKDTLTGLTGTLGRTEDVFNLIKDVQDGELNNQSQRAIKYLIPFNTHFLINDTLNAVVKD